MFLSGIIILGWRDWTIKKCEECTWKSNVVENAFPQAYELTDIFDSAMNAIEFYLSDFIESIPYIWARQDFLLWLDRDQQENHKEILNKPGGTAKL